MTRYHRSSSIIPFNHRAVNHRRTSVANSSLTGHHWRLCIFAEAAAIIIVAPVFTATMGKGFSLCLCLRAVRMGKCFLRFSHQNFRMEMALFCFWVCLQRLHGGFVALRFGEAAARCEKKAAIRRGLHLWFRGGCGEACEEGDRITLGGGCKILENISEDEGIAILVADTIHVSAMVDSGDLKVDGGGFKVANG
ncbi:hypothetical protein LR48_Vigan03g196400 [Vigna angularis]|uniref:Uncharacterized protein n=1 Tax=Phaseolus angularis TaxID=3914 RepID=A0A0L9U7J2_PHAAN|nr:hypothetical protein LR48_Vigan03g196400 [Vigna angularis]